MRYGGPDANQRSFRPIKTVVDFKGGRILEPAPAGFFGHPPLDLFGQVDGVVFIHASMMAPMRMEVLSSPSGSLMEMTPLPPAEAIFPELKK